MARLRGTHGRAPRHLPSPLPSTATTQQSTRFWRNCRYRELAGGRDILPSEDMVWELFNDAEMGVSVTASPLRHSVPCVGFAVQEHDRRGKLKIGAVKPLLERNRAAFAEQGIKNPMSVLGSITSLNPGERFELPDGTFISYEDALGEPQRGKKVLFLGGGGKAFSSSCSTRPAHALLIAGHIALWRCALARCATGRSVLGLL